MRAMLCTLLRRWARSSKLLRSEELKDCTVLDWALQNVQGAACQTCQHVLHACTCLMLPLDKCNMGMDVPSETNGRDKPRE